MNNSTEHNSSIIVSPPSQYLNLTAGETKTGSIKIANPSSSTEPLDFFISIAPYNIIPEDYSADFTTNSAYTDIVNWVTIDKNSGSIEPNEFTEIHYTITVPKDAPAGGQYFAITARNTDNNNSIISEVVEIASIVYARIDGEVIESGKIESSNAPSFVFTPPIKTAFSFSNSGNVHLNATVKTKITNFFTSEKIYDDTTGKYITETVMPETTRFVVYPYDNIPELGIFNFSQIVSYNGKNLNIEKTIFVCPIWFLLLVSFTIIFIILTITLRIKKAIAKKKNRKNANIV